MREGGQVRDRRWEWDEFLSARAGVLGQWETGQELLDLRALDAAIAYQRAQPWWKFASRRNERALEEGRIQIVPQVGHATVEHTVDHILHAEDLKPDRWYMITDTYTRKGQFGKAQEAVDRSRRDGVSYLNGYPVVAHGVAGARAINEATRAVIGTDNNDEDARLAWEIALAGGWTYGTVKSIEQVIQHSRDYPLERMIENQQYMDRLAAHYTERGVPILRRASANLPGWDSLGFKVTVSLIECLLAATQGLKHIDLSLGIGMNLIQDVAAIRTLATLAREHLAARGCADVATYSWTYFFLGDWPLDRGALAGQLAWNASVSALAGCNGMVMKSADESSTTPTKGGFRTAVEICGQVARLIAGQRIPESEELATERAMIEAEVRAVIERLLDMGDGDLAVGACRGVEAGVLDTMFSPWRRLKGKVLVVRDARGALRYLDHGDLPLPREVVAYHRSRIAERERREGTTADLKWVIREATWASQPLEAELQRRPY